MSLLIINHTNQTRTYSGPAVSIPSYTTIVVPVTNVVNFLLDTSVRSDIDSGYIEVQHVCLVGGRTSSGSDSPLNLTDSGLLKVDPSGASPQTVTELENPTFAIYAQDVAVGTTKSMASVLNASGSTVKLRIREIRIINTTVIPLTGLIIDLRLLRCTGHSSGTSLTPSSYDSADSLNSSVTARTGATITGEGTMLRRWQMSTDEWGVGAADSESASHDTEMSIPLYYPMHGTKPITLRSGEGLTLKQNNVAIIGALDILILFTQE